MKKLMLVIILLCTAALAAAQNNEVAVDSGKLLVFAEGKQVGAETFTIGSGGISESSSTLTMGGQAVSFKSRTEHRSLRPVGFEIEYAPNMKMQVSINGTEVKMTGPREASTQTSADAALLEQNVWHHYSFLVRRYDRQKGGVQQFKLFVPSVMQTLTLTLERVGTLSPLPDKSVRLEHYRAVLAGSVNVDVMTDPTGKLVYLNQQRQSEAVREEYAASVAELRAGAAAAPKSAGIDYSAPPGAPFTAEEVTVKAQDWTLAGTLLIPKTGARPFPAVITITGSGQQTRDEPVPIPGLEKYGLMRQIAETLASRGIAVLRVDDRGVGQSTGADTLMTTATTSGFADDVRAQVAYLRSRPEIDGNRIALVGHSEGGIIAPMVASTDPRIAAIVVMAGSAMRGDQISISQLNDALGRDAALTEAEKDRQRAEQRETIRAVVTGGDLSKYPPQVRLPWLKEFWTYDPLQTVRKVRQPILILHGALDRQVTVEQAGMLEQAARGAGNKDVTVRLFPNLNHLFLPAKTGAFSEYSALETSRVGDDLLKTLGDWLGSKFKVRGK
jgi:dienelactone hydrolase